MTNTISLEDAERTIRKYEGLFEANAAVTSSLDQEEVLNLVMNKARELLIAEAASIFLLNEVTDELVLEVSTNLPPSMRNKIRFPKGLGVAGWVAQHGEPVMTDDISRDPRFYPGVQAKTGFRTQSYLCVPLKLKERIIGTAQVLNRIGGGGFNQEDLHLLEGFARQATIAIENARLHQEELEMKRLEEELELARRIQRNLLPKADPEVIGYDISGLSLPCRWVGGDYFDFIRHNDNSITVAVGDVCGKGVPAAVLMSSIQAILHALTDQGLPPQTIVSNLNRYLFRNTSSDRFVTLFYSVLDCEKNILSYINCGHNPPYIFRRNGEMEELKEGGLILGVMEDASYRTGEVNLEEEDMVLMFTDGVTEVHSAKKEMYSEERLLNFVLKLKELPAKEIIKKLHLEIIRFADQGQMEDDVTMVCIKRISN